MLCPGRCIGPMKKRQVIMFSRTLWLPTPISSHLTAHTAERPMRCFAAHTIFRTSSYMVCQGYLFQNLCRETSLEKKETRLLKKEQQERV